MANNTCVCCGQIIPEGRQVCPQCEDMAAPKYDPAEFFSAERQKKTGGNMKVRLTIMTENKSEIPDMPIPEMEKRIKRAWEVVIAMILAFDEKDETAFIEKVEIVREDDADA